MGKVKVKVLGDEQSEQEALLEQKKKREEKAAKKAQVKGVNLGGGERINTVGVSEEEIAKQIEAAPLEAGAEPEETKTKKARGKKQQDKEARTLSKRHSSNSSIVANNTSYPLKNGIEILRKFKKSNFDETVELHINVAEKGVSGQVALPHGTGKKLRILIADDAVIAEVEKGKINFDVLVATPDMMPKLAKVARVLGPRGLMPNPKAGTITPNPEQTVEKLLKGQVSYKTEAAAPIIHMSVGKLSFEDKQIEENVKSVLSAIGDAKISNVTLKSTMSPAVRIQI
jgi:large subunit ribosomal protein L1